VGTVIALPISGLLAENFGWEWIFYVFGCIGLLWCAAWWWIVHDSPEEDRHISDQVKFLSTLRFSDLYVLCCSLKRRE
jgi:ACS family sodium-dependent inorganic phosphate cotransporter